MSDLTHITSKIIALHEDGRTNEQITNLILSEHSKELGHTDYDFLRPVVSEIIFSQEASRRDSMKTIRDLILERFVQKEINNISGKIADEIHPLLNNLAHDIATAEDGERLEALKQKYKKLNDLLVRVAVTSTCADVSVDELSSIGISVEWMIRMEVSL